MQLTLFMKNTFYYSQDQFFCGNLTWLNLKGGINLTVMDEKLIERSEK